jgi:sodium-dependent phosphate cotransporter
LFGIVKVLSLLIVGPIAKAVRIAVNASFPKPFGFATEILLFIIAFLLTIIVQSSNIITATLVPLCGVGIVSLQRVFVMTLGSNIGTTVTGILTAFTQPVSSLKKSMQLAFVYTLFNSLGVLFWLPIPFLRFPKRLAKELGEIVFKYRWFLYCYVITVYFIGPLFIFGLALIPMWIGLALFGIPLIILLILIIILYFLQIKFPKILPFKLRNFQFLPIWLRSLEPLDNKIKKLKCCCSLKKDKNKYTLPNVIRRFSAIEGIVNEGINYSRRNSIISETIMTPSQAHHTVNGDELVTRF